MPRIVRKIIEIDEAKCNGCGQCVSACAEGAIAIRDGKAKLISDVYCDGLGACLGECPEGAITITDREAEAFNEAAVHEHLAKTSLPEPSPQRMHAACPGAAARSLNLNLLATGLKHAASVVTGPEGESPSALSHWPVKLRLAPPTAPFFREADLLLVADCVPFAYADFHERLLQGRPVVIACPKLDDRQPALDKLTAILALSDVRSLTVVHMEVPCCTGLVRMAEAAVAASGREIPLADVTISVRGQRLGSSPLGY
jgi:Pyruvate/2-oxoacid:ferredoxin oxidoreductase delta subunit